MTHLQKRQHYYGQRKIIVNIKLKLPLFAFTILPTFSWRKSKNSFTQNVECSRTLVLPSCSSFKNNNICWQISIINPKHSLFKTLLQPYLQFTSLYLLIISLPISVKRPTNPNTLTQKPFSHLKKDSFFVQEKQHIYIIRWTPRPWKDHWRFLIYIVMMCGQGAVTEAFWHVWERVNDDAWEMYVYFHLHYITVTTVNCNRI